EASTISSPLLATLLRSSDARHVLLVGDVDQLPPIGAGQPFRDLIKGKTVPVTRLQNNYRTGCENIRTVCAAARGRPLASGISKMAEYATWREEAMRRTLFEENDGSVEFFKTEYGSKAAVAANLFARALEARGGRIHEIAILTPHNASESGVNKINE